MSWGPTSVMLFVFIEQRTSAQRERQRWRRQRDTAFCRVAPGCTGARTGKVGRQHRGFRHERCAREGESDNARFVGAKWPTASSETLGPSGLHIASWGPALLISFVPASSALARSADANARADSGARHFTASRRVAPELAQEGWDTSTAAHATSAELVEAIATRLAFYDRSGPPGASETWVEPSRFHTASLGPKLLATIMPRSGALARSARAPALCLTARYRILPRRASLRWRPRGKGGAQAP